MKCMICKKDFETKFIFEKYCSQCKSKAKRMKNKEWYERNKKELSELFKKDYEKNPKKYHSRMKKYRNKNKEKIRVMKHNYYMNLTPKKKNCKHCGIEFYGRENKLYCSNECKSITKKIIKIIKPSYKKLLYNKEDKEKDTTYSSIWLYRQGKMILPFQDMVNKENPYYSEFNPLISQNITNFWSEEENNILDPFGGRTRGIVSGLTRRKYYGFEVSKEVYNKVQSVIDEGKDKFDKEFIPIIYNDDSFNVDKYNLPWMDMIFSCPPYWDLEKYPSALGQLSDIEDYNTFLKQLKQIMIKCCDRLKDNGFICLVVGNFRKNGNLIPFDTDVILLMRDIPNIFLWDKIILQNVNFGHASKRFGAIKHKKITAKVSEYLLVFKKSPNDNKNQTKKEDM